MCRSQISTLSPRPGIVELAVRVAPCNRPGGSVEAETWHTFQQSSDRGAWREQMCQVHLLALPKVAEQGALGSQFGAFNTER